MRIFRSATFVLSLLSMALFTPRGFGQSPVAGDWVGVLDAGGAQLRVAWHVTAAADSSFTSTLDNLDQSVFGVKVKKTEIKGSAVALAVDDLIDVNGQQVNIAGTFEGKLNADQSELDGNWMQTAPNEGGPFPLHMKHQAPGQAAAAQAAAAPPAPPAAAPSAGKSSMAGDWKGVLMDQLHLVLHIQSAADGTLSATLDSVDQGANGIPVTSAVVKDGKLILKVDAVPGGGGYEGTITQDGNGLDGTWTQGPQSLPLKFTRDAAAAAPPAK